MCFPRIGCHFSGLGLKKIISFCFLSPLKIGSGVKCVRLLNQTLVIVYSGPFFGIRKLSLSIEYSLFSLRIDDYKGSQKADCKVESSRTCTLQIPFYTRHHAQRGTATFDNDWISSLHFVNATISFRHEFLLYSLTITLNGETLKFHKLLNTLTWPMTICDYAIILSKQTKMTQIDIIK